MKLNGFVGKGSGKLGASVFAISGGEQIVREYNPVVSNPNTPAQIEQRAKLKLMSQLAAALGGYLAFQKVGLKSARNQFISKNFSLCDYENNKATCDVVRLQLSAGSAFLPEINVASAAGGGYTVGLMQPAAADIQSVRYIVCKLNADNQLSVIGSQLVSEAGDQRHFDYTSPMPNGDYFIFSYGIKVGAGNVVTSYGNYDIQSGEDSATLDANAIAKIAAGNLTKTSGKLATLGA